MQKLSILGPLDQALVAVADKSERLETKAETLQIRGCGAHCRTERREGKVGHRYSFRSASQQRPEGSSSTRENLRRAVCKNDSSPVFLDSVKNEQDLCGNQQLNGMNGPSVVTKIALKAQGISRQSTNILFIVMLFHSN